MSLMNRIWSAASTSILALALATPAIAHENPAAPAAAAQAAPASQSAAATPTMSFGEW